LETGLPNKELLNYLINKIWRNTPVFIYYSINK
jgi:hypothetical protein